jgi:hypothetical protein
MTVNKQMPTKAEQIKVDYAKYLRLIRDVYDYGNKGFPPDVNSDRLLELDEYTIWWNERDARIKKQAEEIFRGRAAR